MRILFIAPQPFYEERGTLIAVDHLLRALSDRGDEVDLLTLHRGEDRALPGLSIHRISPWPTPRRVPPGLSAAKLWCDAFVTAKAIRMAQQGDYHLVYAVEEGAFIALLLHRLFRLPYVFDMDSSMADQIVDRLPLMRPLQGLLRRAESMPMRHALAVIPMCDALARRAEAEASGLVRTLKDVSLLAESSPADAARSDAGVLRDELGLRGPMAMYVGNLEPYQGIDLLLDAFARVHDRQPEAALVIVGGTDTDIDHYRRLATQHGADRSVHFLGPRPLAQLGALMAQADVLVSPRTDGVNTPMKVYSYLDSGVPVLATDLPTHTQVMDGEIAMLCAPEPAAFAVALDELFGDPARRQALASNARDRVASEHSPQVFQREAHSIIGELERQLRAN